MTGRQGGNAVATLKQAVRGAIHEAAQKYRQHVRDREEKEKLERHNKTLGTHVTWQQFTRARKMTLCNMDEFFHFAFYDKTDAQRDEYLTVERQDA